MGSLERRIEALEQLIGPPEQEGTAARDKLFHDFTIRALNAMAHIRRAPIDEEPHRYGVEKLRDEAPITVAAHVAALAHLDHEDADEAREILEDLEQDRGLDPARHEALIDAFAGLVERMDRPG